MAAGVDLNYHSAGGGGSSMVQMDAGAMTAPARALGQAGNTVFQAGSGLLALEARKQRVASAQEEAAAQEEAKLAKERQDNIDSAGEAYFKRKVTAIGQAIEESILTNPGEGQAWMDTANKSWSEVFEEYGEASLSLSPEKSQKIADMLAQRRQESIGTTRLAGIASEIKKRNAEWEGVALDAAMQGDREEFDDAISNMQLRPEEYQKRSLELWGKGKHDLYRARLSQMESNSDLREFVSELEKTDSFDVKAMGEASRRNLIAQAKDKMVSNQDRYSRSINQLLRRYERGEVVTTDEMDQMVADNLLDPEMPELVDMFNEAMLDRSAEKQRLVVDENVPEYVEFKDEVATKYLGAAGVGEQPFTEDENPAMSPEARKKLFERIDKMNIGNMAKAKLFSYAMLGETAVLKDPDMFGIPGFRDSDQIGDEERLARRYLATRLRAVYDNVDANGSGVGALYDSQLADIETAFRQEKTTFEGYRKNLDEMVNRHIANSYSFTLRRDITEARREAPVEISTREQFDALPAGSRFTFQGRTGVK